MFCDLDFIFIWVNLNFTRIIETVYVIEFQSDRAKVIASDVNKDDLD